MLKTLVIITLIQLYWLSFPLIGYALLLVLKNHNFKYAKIGEFAAYILQLHFLVRLFFALLFGMAAYGIVSIFMYTFHLPAIVMTVIYSFFLLFSIGYLLIHFFKHKSFEKIKNIKITLARSKLSYLTLVIALLAISFVAIDYYLSLRYGGTIYLGNDVYVHLARIITILEDGYSFRDGFFEGIIESRYHVNLVYSLYIPISQLVSAIEVLPFDVWRWSLGFFRFLQWLAVFNLAYFIFKYLLKRRDVLVWSYLAVVSSVAFMSGTFFIANYPNQIVNLWVIAYVIGMIIYENYRKYGIIIILAAILLALTHPTYSLMVAIFTAFYIVLRVVFNFRGVRKPRQYVIYLLSIVILMSSPVLTQLFPNYISKFVTQTGVNFNYSLFLPLTPIDDLQLPMLVLGVLTAIYLLIHLRHMRKFQIIFLSLILFIPIIIFNPIAIAILGKFLHTGIFYRFNAMNVLWLILLPLAAVVLILAIGKLVEKIKMKSGIERAVVRTSYVVAITGVLLVSAVAIKPSYDIYEKFITPGGDYEYERIHRLHDQLSERIEDDALVVANEVDSYLLAPVLSVYTLTIPTSHATPTAAMANRVTCQDAIMTNFNLADLKAIDAEYIFLSYWEEESIEQIQRADSKAYLDKIIQTQDFVVYEVDKSVKHNGNGNKSCAVFSLIESGQIDK